MVFSIVSFWPYLLLDFITNFGGTLPRELEAYVVSVSRMQTVEYSYIAYNAGGSELNSVPLQSPNFIVERGSVKLDFARKKYRIDSEHVNNLREFTSRRQISLEAGVSTRLDEKLDGTEKIASIGNNVFRDTPFSTLGVGSGINSNLSMKTDNIVHLSELILNEEYFGLRAEGNVFVFDSLSLKKRNLRPSHLDLRLELDPEKDYLPVKMEFLIVESANPNVQVVQEKLTALEFAKVNSVYFPILI